MEEVCSQNSDLGTDELDKIEALAQAENLNTKRATSWGIKKFEKWCEKRNLNVDLNCYFGGAQQCTEETLSGG